jgi:RNA polymerase sigma-70 factor (ECF subfamily)
MFFKSDNPERKIIKGCQNRKIWAQKALYDTYAGKMLAICRRYSDNIEDAEDLLQDGFIIVFNKIDQYAFKGNFEGWLRRLFVNHCLQFLRKKIHMYPISNMQIVGSESFEIEDHQKQFQLQDILTAIDQLPNGYKLVFNLYVLDGLNHEQIAQELNISAGTSKSQLARAKRKLRTILEKEAINSIV